MGGIRMSLLRESLEKSPIVKRKQYNYFVHPITDGLPLVTKDLLEEITDEILGIADLDCDKIVTAEAMGIPIATALTIRTGIRYVIIRKRPYGMEGEVKIDQMTGYSKADMFINSLKAGERVVFVDDVVSTGGTITPTIKALQEMGVVVVDVVVVVNKNRKIHELEEGIGLKIKTLVDVDIVDGKVVLLN